MPDIGQTFREAREKKKVSSSQAAAATRMKTQHVEALERNDFSYLAAPAYAKGFIRLYADYLGLDPEPLVREYMERHAPKTAPLLMAEEKTYSGPSLADVWSQQVRRLWGLCRPRLIAWKGPLLIGCGIVMLGIFALWLLRGRGPESSPERQPDPAPSVRVDETPRPALPVLREPPDAYLDGAKRATEGTSPSSQAR